MTKEPLESSDCYRSVQIHKGNSSITVITVLVHDGIKDHSPYGKQSKSDIYEGFYGSRMVNSQST